MTTAIVLGAGQGVRLGGGTPKAMRLLGGRPLFLYSVETLERCAGVDSIVAVVPAGHVEAAWHDVRAAGACKVAAVIPGGATRQESVTAALATCADDAEWVVVHDAARPFASVELFARTIESARASGAAIAARRASDTIKRADGLRVVETLPRHELWHAETPQVFRRRELARALAECARSNQEVTDDSRAMELAGHRVALVESDGANFKISSAADWALALARLAGGS